LKKGRYTDQAIEESGTICYCFLFVLGPVAFILFCCIGSVVDLKLTPHLKSLVDVL